VALGDILNIQARTLDVQNAFQQSIGQSEIAVRQAEKNLAQERLRRESMVGGGEGSSGAGAGALDLASSSSQAPSRTRRYRLLFKGGQGPVIEAEPNPSDPGRHRLDLKA
jgi:hypothetical protein